MQSHLCHEQKQRVKALNALQYEFNKMLHCFVRGKKGYAPK